MESVAASGPPITYTQLASRISAVSYAPNGSPFELLCEISRATHHKRGVLLSAAVRTISKYFEHEGVTPESSARVIRPKAR